MMANLKRFAVNLEDKFNESLEGSCVAEPTRSDFDLVHVAYGERTIFLQLDHESSWAENGVVWTKDRGWFLDFDPAPELEDNNVPSKIAEPYADSGNTKPLKVRRNNDMDEIVSAVLANARTR